MRRANRNEDGNGAANNTNNAVDGGDVLGGV